MPPAEETETLLEELFHELVCFCQARINVRCGDIIKTGICTFCIPLIIHTYIHQLRNPKRNPQPNRMLDLTSDVAPRKLEDGVLSTAVKAVLHHPPEISSRVPVSMVPAILKRYKSVPNPYNNLPV